jgi:XisI protein
MEIEKYRKLIQFIIEKHSSCNCEDPEVEIAKELIESGVPKSAIVLGYRSPYMRKFTELAVG